MNHGDDSATAKMPKNPLMSTALPKIRSIAQMKTNFETNITNHTLKAISTIASYR